MLLVHIWHSFGDLISGRDSHRSYESQNHHCTFLFLLPIENTDF